MDEFLNLQGQQEREQTAAGLATFAQAMRVYYAALMAEGFDADKAFMLVMAWQAAMVARPSGKG